MVLEGATSNDSPPAYSEAFPSDTPASDFDPYDSSIGSNGSASAQEGSRVRIVQQGQDGRELGAPVFVDLKQLPQLFSVFGRSSPRATQIVADGVRAQCGFVAGVLQRPITQDEANAVSFHFTKSMRIASYGQPAGLVVGAAIAYRGMNTFRFPLNMIDLNKEGGRFGKDSFPFLQKGQISRAMWHSFRFSLYGVIGVVMGQIFFGSYALSVGSAGRAMDPKLKEFNEKVRQRGRSALEAGVTGARKSEEEAPGARSIESYDMAGQRRSIQEYGRQKRGQEQDDASPSGGAFNQEYRAGTEERGYMGEQEVRQQADAKLSSSRERNSSVEASSRAGEDAFESVRASREGQGQSKSSGSVWDRLRQEAISGKGSVSAGAKSPDRGREESTGSDSFSFSSADEERQLAKAEAQKTFDQRIEREREGRDFTENGKRWR